MSGSGHLDHLIDRICEAGLMPSLWPEVLSEIGIAIGGNGGLLFAVRDGYISAVNSDNFNETMPLFLREGWSERDPLLPRAAALNYAGFLNDGDLLSEEEIATDEVYCNFYRRHGIGYRAGTIIPIPSGDSIAIVMPRHQDNGPVPREVVSFLDDLRPHMARAALTANRLGFERARAQTDALQAIGLPGAVLRERGRLLAANGLFEALMPSLFHDRAERLTLTDAAADELFLAAVGTPLAGNSRIVRSVAIAAAVDRVPMVLHVIPVRGLARDIFTQAAFMVVVTPVDRGAVPSAEVLQGLFDLTPAEAQVARGVARAETIDALAATIGVTRETVRTQLKAVLAKTGLSRQQELVSLLAGKALRGG
ncbi:LuxR family transcriptional regulator [Bradyrhizobium japonicum]|uniref:helix-turn-helix transcriptional regulator n=1 Tax=Bradyrhizobium japonicum TaxID=375 RepID=UPI001BA7DFDD|nr:LuxR family transcriptional regulator [Bradyrhizobium japonicum]MBR0993232.1 LuxR family transcriptional regulator [Bradyrhizobium japonicum]